MNIHGESLFPDLDGFSRSLRMDWEIDRDDLKRQMEHPVELPREDNEDTEIAD
jgi:hypothetical protein